jgi:hypothetical protein
MVNKSLHILVAESRPPYVGPQLLSQRFCPHLKNYYLKAESILLLLSIWA